MSLQSLSDAHTPVPLLGPGSTTACLSPSDVLAMLAEQEQIARTIGNRPDISPSYLGDDFTRDCLFERYVQSLDTDFRPLDRPLNRTADRVTYLPPPINGNPSPNCLADPSAFLECVDRATVYPRLMDRPLAVFSYGTI